MKRLLFLLTVLSAVLAVHAQDDAKQILVFRHSGEVNLFYSNELDSIVNTCVDSLGNTFEDPVAQLFYTKDTMTYVPIAEIDSVAIGDRNAIEFKSNVMEISDASYIIKYENGIIYFKTNTPSNILPQKGQKVYYTERTEIFPCGLCAEITKVETTSDAILVYVNDVELKELFNRFFYAGKFEDGSPVYSKARSLTSLASGDASLSFVNPLNLGDFGSISPDIKLTVSGDIVANPFIDYYNADITLSLDMGVSVKAKSSDSGKIIEYKGPTYSIPVYSLLKLINVDLGASLFCDLGAELSFNYSLTGKRTINEFTWTRRNGVTSFTRKKDNADMYSGEAKADMTLNGTMFLGINAGVDFNIIGKPVGARATVKSGPKFEGELSMGVLTKLAEKCNTELYAKGEISVCLNNELDCGWYTSNIFSGEESYHSLLSGSLELLKRKLNIFPEFKHTVGTSAPSKSKKKVSVATIAQVPTQKENDIPQMGTLARPLDVTLAIVDSDEKVVEESSATTIANSQTSPQGLESDVTTDKDISELKVQPTFKYMDLDIKAPLGSSIQEGVLMQPYTTYMSNGCNTIISGSPFIGEKASNDSTLFIVGSYLPVVLKPDSAFNVPPITNNFGKYVDENDKFTIITTWVDDSGNEFTLNEDSTGQLTDSIGSKSFTYELNNPSAGNILMSYNDEDVDVYTVKSLSSTNLQLYNRKKKYINLTKSE